jgi:hypothetical protein
LVAEVTGYKRSGRLGTDETEARDLASNMPTFVGFAKALFDGFARSQGKPFSGEKDPEYVRQLPLVHRLFPEARSVHIIRDGREVALSTLEWVTPTRYLGRLGLWADEPVAVCALWWRQQVLAGRRGRGLVGADRCLEVRYEDLVTAPELVMREITSFIDLPFDSATVNYHDGRTREEAGLTSKQRWLPPTAGLRDWRATLCERDLQLFEALAGGLLDALGYPRATGPGIAPAVNTVADRCRVWWEQELGASR